MQSRDATGVLVGFAVICLVVGAYSFGRINGIEQAQKATAASSQDAGPRRAIEPFVSQPEPHSAAQAPQTSQQIAVADAKLIALALMMYMQDYDQTFPPRRDGASFNESISPYVKDTSPLLARDGVGGFQYIFDSISLAAIPDRSQMKLGYKETSQGWAWVYADGHVGWEPTP